MYRQFLNDQKERFKAYQEKMKQGQSGVTDLNSGASKDDNFVEDDRKYDTQGSGIRIESMYQKDVKNNAVQNNANKVAGNEPSLFQAFVGFGANQQN